MTEFLQNLIARKKEEIKDCQERAKTSESIDEVRSLGVTISNLKNEIDGAEAELKKLEEERSAAEKVEKQNSFKTIGSYERSGEKLGETATMEYRQAFKEFIQTGKIPEALKVGIKEERAAGAVANLGVLVPETVLTEVIKGVEKVYGRIYSRVRKFNVIGGLKISIGEDAATFTRQAENTSGTPTEGLKITGSVTFGYKIGEIKIGQSIISSLIGQNIADFEANLTKAIVEAYLKAMDNEILNGDDSTQFEGIITDVKKNGSGKVKTTNIIEFTEAEVADWVQWQKKLFAKLPIGFRKTGYEFMMTTATYEGVIKTLKDNQNRPVYSETFNPVDGAEICRFKGKEVLLVENGLNIEDFDTAEAGDIFAIVWVPYSAYGVNSNMQFTTRKYRDESTNTDITKTLVINDGKILDGGFIYALKKK